MALDTGEEAGQPNDNVLLLGGAEHNRLTRRWMRRAEGEGEESSFSCLWSHSAFTCQW